jgi:hypothetical protein
MRGRGVCACARVGRRSCVGPEAHAGAGSGLQSVLHEEVMESAWDWNVADVVAGGVAGCSGTVRRGGWVVGDHARVKVANVIQPSGSVLVPPGATVSFTTRFDSPVAGLWSGDNSFVASVDRCCKCTASAVSRVAAQWGWMCDVISPCGPPPAPGRALSLLCCQRRGVDWVLCCVYVWGGGVCARGARCCCRTSGRVVAHAPGSCSVWFRPSDAQDIHGPVTHMQASATIIVSKLAAVALEVSFLPVFKPLPSPSFRLNQQPSRRLLVSRVLLRCRSPAFPEFSCDVNPSL